MIEPNYNKQERLERMDYAKPLFSRQEVNAAGKKIISFNGIDHSVYKAISIIDNWRASHAYPLNAFYVTLKRRACKVNGRAIAAQRIKRFMSITLKLMHEKNMKLTQMQDIGGCRAVLPTLNNVYELVDQYWLRTLTHTFLGKKDYITRPKPTGYRGIHLKYRFTGSGNSAPYDGMKVEIQIRTQLQHKWATAVEAAATFTKEALKSNQGRKEWLRFFALMSSVFALREGTPTIEGTPGSIDELYNEIRQINREHHIQSQFAHYSVILPHISKQKNAKYFLVRLDPVEMEVTVQGFKANESQKANKAYTDAETNLPKDTSIQVVLVSVASISALKRAYPNYFLDTQDFLGEIAVITGVEI